MNRLIRNGGFALAGVFFLVAAWPSASPDASAQEKADNGEALKKELAALQGTWKEVSREEMSRGLPDAKKSLLVVEGDKFSVKDGDATIIKGTFKLDASKSPKAIDLTITKCLNPDFKGQVWYGIYELDKNGLKWSLSWPGEKSRPKEFATAKETKHTLSAFQKEKR
jgi:uncharacterized protein (TIGR03067 family)